MIDRLNFIEKNINNIIVKVSLEMLYAEFIRYLFEYSKSHWRERKDSTSLSRIILLLRRNTLIRCVNTQCIIRSYVHIHTCVLSNRAVQTMTKMIDRKL